MFVTLGALLLICLVSTTKESREQSRRDVAKWNPLFITVAIVALAVLFGGRSK